MIVKLLSNFFLFLRTSGRSAEKICHLVFIRKDLDARSKSKAINDSLCIDILSLPNFLNVCAGLVQTLQGALESVPPVIAA